MTGRCESCANRATCKKDIGYIWGHCNTDYKPIADVLYTIGVKYGDFVVSKMYAGSSGKYYLKSTRNGRDVFYSDLLWARGYKYTTAKRHLLRILEKDVAAGIDAKAEIYGDIVTVKDGEIVVV